MVWGEVKDAFGGGIAGVSKLIVNWSPLGLFYKAFSGVLSWFGIDLPKNFTDFGANIINGLTNGIKSAIGGAVTAIGDFASGLKSKFTNLLGIKSPSRVFMGFGGNIGQGAALGILQSVPGVQGAAGKLAGVALAGALAVNAHAQSGISQAVQAVQPQMATVSQAARNHAVPAAAAQSGMTIHFSPNISVGGGDSNGSDVRGQVQEGLKLSMRELEQMLRRLQAEQQRRAF